LKAATKLFSEHHLHLAALEIGSSDDEYLWESIQPTNDFDRYTLFSSSNLAKIPFGTLQKRLWATLRQAQPAAIAINGYSSKDAQLLLLWCRLHQCFPILMSDSKQDDVIRFSWKEAIKKLLAKQYGACLCAGKPHQEYLESLGFPAERIFTGYDAIDNQFFRQHSQRVRQNPQAYRHLPGLEDPKPFFLASGRFVPRKNFAGLVLAYNHYQGICEKHNLTTWRLVILGDGPERDHILKLIRENSLENKITLAGVHSSEILTAYYGLASIFIHPALQDQWGLVVNEAMASGLPILVSQRAGCVSDLLEDGKEGFTFDPDNTEELATRMYQMSSHTVDIAKMGAAASKKISLWDVERFAESLYKAVMIGLG
jgi:glycosyltransferase involved in cell wall biosynthesis